MFILHFQFLWFVTHVVRLVKIFLHLTVLFVFSLQWTSLMLNFSIFPVIIISIAVCFFIIVGVLSCLLQFLISLQYRCRHVVRVSLHEQVRQVNLSRARRGSQVFGAPQDGLGWRVTWASRGLPVDQAGQGRRDGPTTLPTSRDPTSPTNGCYLRYQRSTLPSSSTGQCFDGLKSQREQQGWFMWCISWRNKSQYIKLPTDEITKRLRSPLKHQKT